MTPNIGAVKGKRSMERSKPIIVDGMKRVREKLRLFRDRHEIAPDWHSPPNMSAFMVGDHLDNAGGNSVIQKMVLEGGQEYVVILRSRHTNESLAINLSTLCALACFAKD